MSAPPVSEALLAEAIELAQRAGTMTLSWFQSSSLDVEQKSDGTPVTDADRTAEQLIRDHLSVHHPDDSIVGEEHGRREGTSTRRWYIDPIDGTRSFVHGVPLFATLVAVEDEHGMAAGVIYLPALGETVAAGRGQGCIWNDSACRVSSTAQLGDAVLTRSEYGNTPPDMIERLNDSPLSLRMWGDAFGYALVATGRLDAMLDHAAHPWDVAPMSVIMEEAGGRFTDLFGNRDVAGVMGGSGLASNGTLHEEVLAVIAS